MSNHSYPNAEPSTIAAYSQRPALSQGAPGCGAGAAAPVLDGYDVFEQIGRGGMGTVWRARQLATGRDVAVKLLGPAAFGSERDRLRFEREVELAARLEHPSIARVYDSGLQRGYYFYSMELIDGLPLDEYARGHKLGTTQLVALLLEVCRAVRHAHQHGIIHRDLKPMNVLVDAAGRPHVLDFGLAKALLDGRAGETFTLDGEVAGTLGFMSPEQAGGGPLDTRTDVYSLGVILYGVLTGKPPHSLDGPALEVMRRIRGEEVTPPRRADPAIDRELEAVLLKALARGPAERYGSAAELADDLDRYLRGDPLSARPPTLAYFVRKRVRRYRAPLLVAVAVAGTLLTMGVAAEVRVRHEKDVAIAERRRAEEFARKEGEQRADAEASAVKAKISEANARAAERQSEISLAQSLIAQGDALAEGDRWVEAKKLYLDARARLSVLSAPTLSADLALDNAYVAAPPPLLRFGQLDGHTDQVTATAVSPDGRLGASGGADRAVILWDLMTGRRLRKLPGHTQTVKCLAFSPDGTRLLSGSDDRTARLWDVASGTEVFRLPHDGRVYVAGFAAEGKRCMTGGSDTFARIWDVSTGKPVNAIGHPARFPITVAALSPDGRQCYFSGNLWNVETGQVARSVAFNGEVSSVAFSGDGFRLVAGGIGPDRSGLMTVYDLRGDTSVNLVGHAGVIRSVAISTNTSRLLSAGVDGSIRQWRTNTGRPLCAVYGDGAAPDLVSCSGNCRLAFSSDGGRGLCLWDTSGDAGVRREVHNGAVLLVSIEPNGRLAVSGCDFDPPCLWDVATGGNLRRLKLRLPYSTWLVAAAISPDGRQMLVATREEKLGVMNAVRLWDLTTGKFVQDVCRFENIWSVAFSPDGKLALAASGNDLRVFDTGSWRETHRFHSYWTLKPGVTFGHAPGGGTCLAGATTHGAAAFWHLATGLTFPGPLSANQTGDISTNAAFTPDLARAVAGSGTDLWLWDSLTGTRLHTFTGHHDDIRAVAISPDGRWAASASDDHTIKLWDLATQRLLRTFNSYGAALTTICFTPDGRGMVSGSEDGSVRVWDFSRAAALLAFQPRIDDARRRLAADPADATALSTLAEWYSLAGHGGMVGRVPGSGPCGGPTDFPPADGAMPEDSG